jgi:hypothetical protein
MLSSLYSTFAEDVTGFRAKTGYEKLRASWGTGKEILKYNIKTVDF